MHWTLYVVITFTSSTTLYLILRKLRPANIPNEILNLAFFLLPAVALFVLNTYQHIALAVSIINLALLGLVAVFLWLGNSFLLRSLKITPNAGYPVLVGKSYVVATTLLSPFFFGAALTPKTIFAVAVILGFLYLVLVDKGPAKHSGNRAWIAYAFLTFGFWSAQALVLISMNDSGIPSTIMLMYISLCYSAIVLLEMAFKKTSLRPLLHNAPWLFALSVVTMSYNLFVIVGYKAAPNPGFMDAASAASVAAIAVLSAALFHDELTPRKCIGIGGAIFGLILLLV
ncbi:MAG TPA: hypothetical protein PKV72_05580 [Candidatus Peribacteria bacterium]|nr:hypothetical protein [Candidatus Peribacteria bacterium]